MEIRVLKYFLAAAREGSITAAANFLHLTQPTLSRQLKDLEKELGKKLFVRSNYNIKLTDEGMVLRKRAEDILEMVEKTEKEFQTMDDLMGGDIYIGSAETASIKYFAQAAKDLQPSHPHIRYHLYSGNSEYVMERLDKGLIDFGVIVQPVDLSKYNYITIPTKDIWGVIMKKDSPLAAKNAIQSKDLIDVPLICSRQAIDHELSSWFGDHFEKIHINTTYNLLYNASVMVKEGLGYAIGFDKLVDTGTDSELCFRPLEPSLESGMYIIWKKYQVFPKAVEIFIDKMKQNFLSHQD